MFLHVSVIMFTGGGVCLWVQGVYCSPGQTPKADTSHRDDHWNGRYASYWNAFLFTWTCGMQMIGKHWYNVPKQECIPVGCIPPACCLYLPACTALGVPGPGGCTWSQGVYLVPGGACQVLPTPVDRILDIRFWKYYLAPNFVCGR